MGARSTPENLPLSYGYGADGRTLSPLKRMPYILIRTMTYRQKRGYKCGYQSLTFSTCAWRNPIYRLNRDA